MLMLPGAHWEMRITVCAGHFVGLYTVRSSAQDSQRQQATEACKWVVCALLCSSVLWRIDKSWLTLATSCRSPDNGRCSGIFSACHAECHRLHEWKMGLSGWICKSNWHYEQWNLIHPTESHERSSTKGLDVQVGMDQKTNKRLLSLCSLHWCVTQQCILVSVML